MSLALLASATLLLSGAVQEGPSPGPRPESSAGSNPVNTVAPLIVEGRRLTPEQRERAISDFVQELAAPTRRDKLARWRDSICPGVVGLPQRQGEYIAERIAQEARALGLHVGSSGCRANVLVMVTPEPERAARRLHAERPAYFAQGASQLRLTSGGGGQSLDDFFSRPRAVRWWHVARLIGADGQPIEMIELRDPSTPRGAGRTVPLVRGTMSSRLTGMTREDLVRAVLIVDSGKVRGVTYEALASYLAMAALAQLDPEASGSELSTIMSLFGPDGRDPAAPSALTRWDRAYLRGLYGAPADAKGLNIQMGAIRRSLRTATE